MRRFACLAVAAMIACSGTEPPARPVATSPPRDSAALRVHALLLNGGGSKPQNFQSHLLHVQQLVAQLEQTGVDRSRISVFSADGEDPEPDVALRDDAAPANFWLVDGTRLEMVLRPPVHYVDTSVGELPIRPATRPALAAWFDDEGRRLGPGDVLLLYVTDHGTKNAADTANNHIVLWGKDERLSVQELSALLAGLDAGVRVVTVMSQCYSGAFGGLAVASAGSDRPAGTVCGYFSSTADRPAYGCYPENRGRENVGHSFHFLETFAATGRLDAAHDEVLVADATPDVPLRSSDLYLEDVLRRAAETRQTELAPFVDELLAEAWRDRKGWEPELRRLDRIGAAFGVFSPRSLHELDEQSKRIDGMVEQLKMHGKAWQDARESVARANLDRFVETHPDWKDRLAEPALAAKPRPEIDAVATDLLPAIETAVAADPTLDERFRTLRENAERAKAIGYRMEVRQGVILRMRALLVALAGRVYLASGSAPTERTTYDALRACEQLELPPVPPPPGTELVRADPFPVLEDDVAVADSVLPGWLGIQFRQAKDSVRTEHGLSDGAASVMMVYDDSPARAAGLREGDVVVGPPNAPFAEKDQIREWVMRSVPGETASLEILRGGVTQVVSLVPATMPRKWPSLPGPPKIGSVAPGLRLDGYRGKPPTTLASGRPHLLFFWATWCAICKDAVPEMLAFGAARDTEIVAITDEAAPELDPFFADWKEPFPALVASDETRAAFRSYGVSGTPTFVLVDGDGIVREHATGYAKKKGLALGDWKWDAAPTASGG